MAGWKNVLEKTFSYRPYYLYAVQDNKEVISSEQYGILINRQAGKELADKIIEALHKDWDTQKLIDYARQNTWKRIMEKVFCEFEAAIG